MLDPGTGACRNARVEIGMASDGAILNVPVPFLVGDISSSGVADYSFRYLAPDGITRFRSINYASCTDDGGNICWLPGPPPV